MSEGLVECMNACRCEARSPPPWEQIKGPLVRLNDLMTDISSPVN